MRTQDVTITLDDLGHSLDELDSSTVVDGCGSYWRTAEQIGKGGCGSVYRGYRRDTRAPVAIKLLAEEVQDCPQQRKAFCREAKLLSQVSHETIVGVKEFGRNSQGRLYFAMDLIDGVDLQHRLIDESIPVLDLLEMTQSLASAISYLHNLGIVHRDVKSENIVVRDEGGITLIDFGTAVKVEDEDDVIVGTPRCMAPEQLAGKCSETTDIWAIGVLLYECIAGASPFYKSGDKLDNIFKRISSGTVPAMPASVPAAVQTLIYDCLQTRPQDRPTIDEVHSRLAELQITLCSDTEWGIVRTPNFAEGSGSYTIYNDSSEDEDSKDDAKNERKEERKEEPKRQVRKKRKLGVAPLPCFGEGSGARTMHIEPSDAPNLYPMTAMA
tara:strand:+ start:31012 stop:32160 length:1149 start_codon:yes stop_codon:yes gene_type:complete